MKMNELDILREFFMSDGISCDYSDEPIHVILAQLLALATKWQHKVGYSRNSED